MFAFIKSNHMNSKQKLIILVCILMSTITYAQGIKFGLETGLNIATLHVTPKSAFSAGTLSSKSGLKLGCVLDIGLGKGFSIETGLLYSRKGVKLSDKFLGQSFEVQYRYNYIEIPLYAKYKFKGLVFGIGPYIAVIAGASYKGVTVDTAITEKIAVGNDPNNDGVKRMDAGLNFKAGYLFPIGLYLTTQYGFGFSNTSPGVGFTAKNSVISFSVGYYFGKHSSSKPKAVKSE
jgi:hypothetical protein